MIGRIRGQLVAIHPPEILVDVGGVGYELQVPMTTLFQLPNPGDEVALVTHMVVREDAQQLFGFAAEQDRRLFRELIKVSGVGPKLALALLSGMDAVAFARCVERDDVSALTAVPGVGRKTAERLLVELRDKAGRWLGELMPIPPAADATSPDTSEDARFEAEQALTALGYKPAEAARWVAQVDVSEASTSADIIRLALRASAPGRSG